MVYERGRRVNVVVVEECRARQLRLIFLIKSGGFYGYVNEKQGLSLLLLQNKGVF